MADDASYNTFLTRANQDPMSGHSAEGTSTSQARSKFDASSTSSTNEAVPASLRMVNATYTSDTDSDFEPVFLSYASHALPSTAEFEKVLGAKGKEGKVEELSVKDWDPRGEYGRVVEAVRRAGEESRGTTGTRGEDGGEDSVKVFRVEEGTRVEYYVVAVGERSLLGVVARAVES